ncbi:MAG: hypothetical protein JWQ98_1370 [Chlorobi bacterium]|nr:hypothetical protein [Chlorobiota bacterium]
MTDQLQAMLGLGSAAPRSFPPTSRYSGVDTATLEAEGKTIIYLRRRFVPAPERFALLQEHVVSDGDRLDNIAAHYLGDPEMFWRICDANGVMRPEEATGTIGRRLRITLPEGIPGGIDG